MADETKNIEALISKVSFEIVNENILNENQINKLLSILTNDGVYAMWVYALYELGIEFEEDKEKLKRIPIFVFLYKIAEAGKFVNYPLDFDKLVEEIVKLTQEIVKLTREIAGIRNEIKKLYNNEAKKQKEQEIKQKKEEIEQKEQERMEKLNEYFLKVSEDLDKILFLKQLLEKTLIYARYHAKAMGN